jgi:acetyl-CoA acetyltransferase
MSSVPCFSKAGTKKPLAAGKGLFSKAALPPPCVRGISVHPGIADPVSGLNMGETAEVLAREFGIGRDAQDAWRCVKRARRPGQACGGDHSGV